jgi:hypothetical protein
VQGGRARLRGGRAQQVGAHRAERKAHTKGRGHVLLKGRRALGKGGYMDEGRMHKGDGKACMGERRACL